MSLGQSYCHQLTKTIGGAMQAVLKRVVAVVLVVLVFVVLVLVVLVLVVVVVAAKVIFVIIVVEAKVAELKNWTDLKMMMIEGIA